MKRIIVLLMALILCTGSAMGEMKGPRGGDQTNLQQGIDQMEGDPEAAMRCFLDALEAGNRKAARYVGMMYEQGLGVDPDYALAAEYYEKGVESGDLTSIYYLGLLYEQGLGVKQDYGKAAELYAEVSASDNKSATGVVAAGYALGRLYEQGLGVEQDLSRALALYREAAEYGNEDAAAALERLGTE